MYWTSLHWEIISQWQVLLFAIRPSRDNLVALASPPWSAVKNYNNYWSQYVKHLLFEGSFLHNWSFDSISALLSEVVGQSTMQLTCCGTTRNFRKIRLQSSLLNCDYTLQVLQHISTRLYQRLHCNDVYVCFYYPNNTQVQTATFQTNGLRSVRLYVHNT